MNGGKIVLVVCMLLAGLSTARAGSITLYQNSYSFSDGGEFTAKTSPDNFLSNYAPTAILNGGFETFCVQSNVYFYPGATYSYVLTNTESTGQKLTLGAAFLYDEFATGKLTGYDYSNSDPSNTRQTDNGELQLASGRFKAKHPLADFRPFPLTPSTILPSPSSAEPRQRLPPITAPTALILFSCTMPMARRPRPSSC